MKKHFVTGIILTSLLIIITVLIIEHDKQKNFEFRLTKMNARIKQLHEFGHSWEEARKLGAIEAGFIPIDAEYKRLKSD